MHRIIFNYLCDAFVNIFVIQTFVEIVACMNPSTVGAFVRGFNRFDPEKVIDIGSSVSGYALSAPTRNDIERRFLMVRVAHIMTFIIIHGRYVYLMNADLKKSVKNHTFLNIQFFTSY